MDYTYVIYFFVIFASLFTIINPFATIPIFLTISKDDTEKKKRKMAKKASIAVALTLFVFSLIGTYILNIFSITIEAFRIAGGILITIVGFQMIYAKSKKISTKKEEEEAINKEDISIVPLAIPLLSGPGAMTTSIVLMTNAVNFYEKILLIFAILLVSIITYIVLSNATKIEKIIGENGMRVIEKIFGLIVIVIGVQFILNGFDGFIGLMIEKYF